MILRRLTDRQRQFVREYLVDLNGARAAVRAGYSRRGASQRGWALRRNPAVAAELETAMADRARLVGITAERVLFEIALLAFANILDYVEDGAGGAGGIDLSRLTRDEAAAISALQVDEYASGAAGGEVRRVRIKLADKSRNLELIGRHLGLFAHMAPRERPSPAGAGVPAAVRKLSDIELSQRVLGILARGRKAAAGG